MSPHAPTFMRTVVVAVHALQQSIEACASKVGRHYCASGGKYCPMKHMPLASTNLHHSRHAADLIS